MKTTYAQLLIVSNDTITLTQLGDALHQIGLYAVTMTNNLIHAHQMVAAGTFDLILLDVSLIENDAAARECLAQMQENVVTPVIVAGTQKQTPNLLRCLQSGATDYLLLPTEPILIKARVQAHVRSKRLQEQAVSTLFAFNELEKLADDLRLQILPLGIALSTEQNYERLLERIVLQAMAICNADVGRLFLRTEDNYLRYAFVHTQSLGLSYGGTTGPKVPHSDIPLFDTQDAPNHSNVVTYVALEGIAINIGDIYDDSGFDFSGTKRFDTQNNYHSVSCLTVPLTNQDVIGVLQLINAQDSATGEIVPFDAYHQLVAEAMASLAAITLHNRNLREREAALLRFKQELEIGRKIQASFFPAYLPQPPGWELVARFQPAHEVAGDFYDVFPMPFGKLGFVIGDVCDKGIGAAMFMALVRSLLRSSIQQHYYLSTRHTPAEDRVRALLAGKRPFHVADTDALLDAIRLINAYIGSNHGDTHVFTTLVFGILDPLTGQIMYVNCGHVPPVILDVYGIRSKLMPTGPALGLRPDAVFSVGEVSLGPGDTLFTFTDGITEARNAEGAFFGLQRLQDILVAHKQEKAVSLVNALETAVSDFSAGAEPSDDMAVLVLQRKK